MYDAERCRVAFVRVSERNRDHSQLQPSVRISSRIS